MAACSDAAPVQENTPVADTLTDSNEIAQESIDEPDSYQETDSETKAIESDESESAPAEELAVEIAEVAEDDTIASVDAETVDAHISQFPLGTLSQDEIDGLLFMREEEKLARDVYQTLYEQWEMRIFSNIARSEQNHTDAVLSLINRYELDDPSADLGAGEYSNPDLQALYDQLVAQGSQSLLDALHVGAAIEEIDILDLEEYIAQTDKEDIQLVYENLMAGSENHLRAFVSVIEKRGDTYQAQYMSDEAFDSIISASVSRGQGRG
ncbi:MAG: DUF2202 domain-containing protein [Chloroflexota bacterium]